MDATDTWPAFALEIVYTTLGAPFAGSMAVTKPDTADASPETACTRGSWNEVPKVPTWIRGNGLVCEHTLAPVAPAVYAVNHVT